MLIMTIWKKRKEGNTYLKPYSSTLSIFKKYFSTLLHAFTYPGFLFVETGSSQADLSL